MDLCGSVQTISWKANFYLLLFLGKVLLGSTGGGALLCRPQASELTPVPIAHSHTDLVKMSCNVRDAHGVDRQWNDGVCYFSTSKTATSLARVSRGFDEMLVYLPQLEASYGISWPYHCTGA